jgi:flagellar motor switch protein FliM
MSMRIGNSDGTIYWGIPGGLLKSLRDSVSHQRVIESQDQLVALVNRLKEHTQRFTTVIDATLCETAVSLEELINLKPGDVISLDHRVSDPALVSINGKHKFSGEIAISNDRRTIRMVAGD